MFFSALTSIERASKKKRTAFSSVFDHVLGATSAMIVTRIRRFFLTCQTTSHEAKEVHDDSLSKH